ncbi:hypothetical protein BC939DRAFT_438522 [Gamsiella multidivaricata]|uniref:uncharacterized protein n=1 Tax=Gamsiella multidivaricata TaxID=101098 RepID=UPI0022206D96|nr:uncharacterized protein BC939DRAFT_438522 [Gamsiella multidivaricata]KAI7830611.1 hypothetical protein BC939DRAFT_438522 [Gamsiella multidivaricata]
MSSPIEVVNMSPEDYRKRKVALVTGTVFPRFPLPKVFVHRLFRSLISFIKTRGHLVL